jgi:hypothetical protein
MILKLCTRSAVSKSKLRGYSTGEQAHKPKPTSDEPQAQATEASVPEASVPVGDQAELPAYS